MSRIGPISAVILIACALVFSWAAYGEYNIEQGRKAFTRYGCGQCHLAGGAPDLTKVKKKYDRATIARFIHNPEDVYREKGRRPLNPEYVPMPELHVTEHEAKQLALFLTSSD